MRSPDTARAALWMLGAIVSFTAMALAGRAAGLTLDTFEIMFYRSAIGASVICTVLLLRRDSAPLHSRQIPRHFMRNVAHFTGQNLWFYALTAIPLAQVFALEFTAPIWAMLLAAPMLGERITRRAASGATLGFAGVLVIAQPGAGAITPGLMAAAGCAVCFGLTAVLTRRITRTENALSVLFWLTILQAAFGALCAGWDGQIMVPHGPVLLWLGVIALTGLGAHLCLTMALSLAPAARVMPVDFLRLPLIAVLGAWFYHEPLSWALVMGSLMIIGANLVTLNIVSKK